MSVPSARLTRPLLAALLIIRFAPAPYAAFAQQAQQNPPAPGSARNGSPAAKGNAAPAPPPLTPEVRKAIAQYQAAERLSKSGKRLEAIAAFGEFTRLALAAKMGAGAMLPAYDRIYILQQERGDAKGMEQTLGQMARLAPQNPGVYVALAALYLTQQRFDEAKTNADRALELKPPAPLASQAHFARGAWAYSHKQWSVAETEYQAAANLTPASVPAQYNLLLTQNEQHKTKQALATANALLKIAPRNTSAHLMKAALLRQEHDLPAALAEYQAVLKYEPRNVVALFNSGLLYAQTGRTDEAITAYNACIAVAPRDFGAQYNLGLLYSGLRNNLAARARFQVGVQIAPQNPQAVYQLAVSERELANVTPEPERKSLLSASEKHFRQAIALNPADTNAENQLALLYERDNRFDQALAVYRARLVSAPDNADTVARIAHLDLASHSPDAAIAEWRSYRTRKPADPVSYSEVADLLEAQGKWQEAALERQEQIQRDPKNAAPRLALAQDYAELKQVGDAQTQYEQTLALDANALDVDETARLYAVAARRNWRRAAWRGLAQLREQSGKPDEAAAFLANVQQDDVAASRRDHKPPDAQATLELAQLRERAKQPEQARAELKNLTQLRPDDPLVFAALGDFEERQGHIEDAAFAYTRAEERASDPVAQGLKTVTLFQKHNQPPRAVTEAMRLLAKYPRDPRLAEPLAQSLELTRDDARALAVYDALLKATPDDPLTLDKKAVVLTRLKRYDDALAVRQRLVVRTPREYQSYANVGYLYTLKGQPDAYRQWLIARAQATPAQLPAQAALIDAFVQQKKEDEGWQTLRGIVAKHPADPDVQEAYIAVLAQHNRMADALALRRQIAKDYPAELEAQTRLNGLLLANGSIDEADALLTTYVARPGLSAATRLQARNVLAQQLAAHDKTEPAIAQYRQILQAAPRDFAATLALGRLYIAAGRAPDALALYETNAQEEKSPPVLRAYFLTLAGDINARQGQTGQAQEHYQRALRLNPQSKEAAQALQKMAPLKSDGGK